MAFSSEEDTQAKVNLLRLGFAQLEECPGRPQDLVLNEGFASASLEVAVQSGQISWSGGYLGNFIQVTTAGGAEKWTLMGAINSPAAYGTAPAGTQQLFPETGAPAQLVSGDKVVVSVGGEYKGLPLAGAGEATAP